MSIDENEKSRGKISRLAVWFCLVVVVLSGSYFGYYMYWESKLQPPEGFSIEVDTTDLKVVGAKWLEAYTEQYRGKFVPWNQKLMEYSLDNIEIKETNVIQMDFSLVTQKLDEKTASNWKGFIQENKIKCQWVLWFKEEPGREGKLIYTVIRLQRPAEYDFVKYQTSGKKERDEYKYEYEAEVPYEQKQYTYKIENKVCYVSYDAGSTWKEVPVKLETLVEVGDGRPYSNKLQEKSYVITPEKTAFVYGGTRKNPLMMTYSEDQGTTWKTTEVSKTLDSVRVKFSSFPSVNVGYVIATGGRTMSQEGQVIYKTINGGATWKEVGSGPSTWLLQSGGFVDENLGFMSYPKIDGAQTNFYRTEDGGKTFQPVILPAHKEEWMGITLEPFIQPDIPYFEKGQLFLLIGQGDQGDFKGGSIMAKYKSNDKGKTWSFVELVEPPSKEKG